MEGQTEDTELHGLTSHSNLISRPRWFDYILNNTENMKSHYREPVTHSGREEFASFSFTVQTCLENI